MYIKFRERRIRMAERKRFQHEMQIATNELKALRAQMNPHFIFNSLNSIQHYIINNDEAEAIKYLSKFSRLIRAILNNSEKTSVILREELEGLKLYLDLETMRFEGKIQYEIVVDKNVDVDYLRIPSLLIQPYVENAILHGLVPKDGNGKLTVKLKEEDGYLICSIIDDGIGIKKSQELKSQSLSAHKHTSMGMRISNERLDILNRIHQSTLSMRIKDLVSNEGKVIGTQVDIFIPLNEKE